MNKKGEYMIKYVFILLLCVSCINSAEETVSDNLLLIIKDSKYGFINKNGEIVVKPVYEHAREFSDGLATVRKDSLIGYIDNKGDVKIKFKYKQAFSFSDGFGVVKNDNGNSEVINKNGKNMFKKEFQYAFTFSEGLMQVSKDDKYGFIDRNGNLVIDYQFDQCWYAEDKDIHIKYYPFGFFEGFAPVCLDGKSTFIDKKGKPLTDFIFDEVDYFSHGLALVSIDEKDGIINTKGDYVVKPEYEYISDFLGSYIALKKNGKFGFIDEAGKTVIPFQYDVAESFRGNRGLIAVKNDKNNLQYGFIDKQGTMIIEPQFDMAYTFTEDGYAIVEKGKSSGIINTDGGFVIPLLENTRFDPLIGVMYDDHLFTNRNYVKEDALIYSDTKTGKRGLMKINGEKITEPVYWQVEHFKDGIAKVQTAELSEYGYPVSKTIKTGYIDKTGKYIWEPTN